MSPGCPGKEAKVPATCEPRYHTAADSSHRTLITGFQEPAPEFSLAPSLLGPLGATLPLGTQMVTAAITQGEGMVTRSPSIKVTKAGESCLPHRVPRDLTPGGRGSGAGLRTQLRPRLE